MEAQLHQGYSSSLVAALQLQCFFSQALCSLQQIKQAKGSLLDWAKWTVQACTLLHHAMWQAVFRDRVIRFAWGATAA